jgi:hypothetical protein
LFVVFVVFGVGLFGVFGVWLPGCSPAVGFLSRIGMVAVLLACGLLSLVLALPLGGSPAAGFRAPAGARVTSLCWPKEK